MFFMPPKTHTSQKKEKKRKKRKETNCLLRVISQVDEIFKNKKKTLKNCTSIKKLQTLINYITDT